jgi:hypothetical protein
MGLVTSLGGARWDLTDAGRFIMGGSPEADAQVEHAVDLLLGHDRETP